MAGKTADHLGPDQAWLDQVQEEILEPELPICDPHHHFWHRDGLRYQLDELIEDTGSGHNVVSTVFIECRSMYRAEGPAALQPLGETEYVNGIAAQSASGGYGPTRAAAAIVGHADLKLGAAVEEVLRAHMAIAPDRFRGIRHSTGWVADPGVRNAHLNPDEGDMASAEFRAGFACLAPLGLTFEAWFYHPQIHELIDLARAFPETTIILDHFGGPLGVGSYKDRHDEIFAYWKTAVADLKDCANVHFKLGGIAMPLNGYGWHKQAKPPTSVALAESQKRFHHHCIETFGAQRCMFESNFPVDKASVSYPVLWNAFKRIAEGASTDEKAALFHDTAARVYRI